MPDVTRTARTSMNRRLHASASRAGLDHGDLRDLCPMLFGEDAWRTARRSMANLEIFQLHTLTITVEGWHLVQTLREQKGVE